MLNWYHCNIKKGYTMTYDRMNAKTIHGQHCRFCGADSLPLVKTKCCEQWICCDTEFLSFRGNGYCQFEHEHESICYFHYNEKHQGLWQECKECKEFLGEEQFEIESKYPINNPTY